MSDSGLFAPAPGPATPTVLIVDDEVPVRKIAAGVLARQYRVLEADGVVRALELVAAEPVDLVLMDVMMPGTNGYEGCRRLKAATKDFLPVLLLTALDTPDDVIAGLEAGADDFLTKPVNLKELELRVATFIRLRRQEQEIARQVVKLRELIGLKDDLVGVLVHDLRNPLAAVISIFHLLERTVRDPETQEDVRVGLEAARRVVDLADDLLLVRLLEEGQLVPVLAEQPAEEIVREAVEVLRPVASARQVRLELTSSGAVRVPVDRKLLRRAVENLISNAVKYTRGSVEVTVAPRSGSAEVLVADRGPGIPDAFKPVLFEKFGSVEARAGSERRGVGLGLYMVSLVARAHRGTVSVEDRVGGGAIFRLRLGTRV